MPTSEYLTIVVAGNIITEHVPATSIKIVNERGKRVSNARFKVEDGLTFGFARGQRVIIYSNDMTAVYFNGFVMELPAIKRGISIDYNLDCSSVEILLQRAIVNGNYSGTDDVILGNMLDGAYPDYSDMFDWSSGVTQTSLSDLSIDFADLNLMDALDSLSMLAGNISFAPSDNPVTRINLIKNPSVFSSMYRYGPNIDTNAYNYEAGWPEANTEYDSTGGNPAGCIKVTSWLKSASNNLGFVRIGREDDSDDLIYKVKNAENAWYDMRFQFKHNSISLLAIRVELCIYDEDGVYLDSFSSDVFGTATTGTWLTWTGNIDLSDSRIPETGYIEPYLFLISFNSYTAYLDNFLMELRYSETAPTVGSYFDGETVDAWWQSVPYDSESELGRAGLTWGSNRDAPFDLDIGSGSNIFDDLKINYDSSNSLGALIVNCEVWENVEWIYSNNGNSISTHFDLETEVFAADGDTLPKVYKNIGSDGSPSWDEQDVYARESGQLLADVLYAQEKHWVEFGTAPPDLELSWRVVGRIKKRIRFVSQNESLIDETGLEFTDTITIEGTTTEGEAVAIAQAELERREPSPMVSFTTYEPGILAGDEIDIADNLQNFNQTLIVQRVTRRYLNGGKGKFFIEAGVLQEDLGDIIYNTNNSASNSVPIGIDAQAATISTLVDDNSDTMVDDNGDTMIDISYS